MNYTKKLVAFNFNKLVKYTHLIFKFKQLHITAQNCQTLQLYEINITKNKSGNGKKC